MVRSVMPKGPFIYYVTRFCDFVLIVSKIAIFEPTQLIRVRHQSHFDSGYTTPLSQISYGNSKVRHQGHIAKESAPLLSKMTSH